MVILKKYSRNIVIIGVPLFIICILFLLVKSSAFSQNPDILSKAISIDLLLTLPFIYFLFIRKTVKKRQDQLTTVIPVLIIGFLIGTAILPKENQEILELFKIWILPFIELTVLTFVILKVRKTIAAFKLQSNPDQDFYTALKATCSQLFSKKLSIVIVTEIAVFYYGFVLWKKTKLKKDEFSYHKNSGTIALLAGIMLIVGIETYVLHVLLIQWSAIAAWIVTFLSVYSGLQLFGIIKSLSKRPIKLTPKKLYLRYGILSETNFCIHEIESIEISSTELEPDSKTKKLSPLGNLDNHNVLIRLKNEQSIIGLYGFKKSYKTLAVFVDEPSLFKNSIESKLGEKE